MGNRDSVVDAALELADAGHWERVRLHDVAKNLGCSLEEIRLHFREKEEIVDAWFDRADRAMLEAATESISYDQAILAWLDALAPYRRVTREMIMVRLEPGHLHHQVPALLRISRTVQWMREAAGRGHAFVARALDEAACTAVFMGTFMYWLFDESPGQQATRGKLEQLVDARARLDLWTR